VLLRARAQVADYASLVAALSSSLNAVVEITQEITFTGEITISHPVTVRGYNSAKQTLNGGGTSRMFFIYASGSSEDIKFEYLDFTNVRHPHPLAGGEHACGVR